MKLSRYESRPPRNWRAAATLSTQTEALDDRAVAVDVGFGQVVQQPAALTDEQQQTPTTVVVVLVGLEVLGEVGDPTAQQRDLHLSRPGVGLGGAVLGDNLLLYVLGQRHGRLPFSLQARPVGLIHDG